MKASKMQTAPEDITTPISRDDIVCVTKNANKRLK